MPVTRAATKGAKRGRDAGRGEEEEAAGGHRSARKELPHPDLVWAALHEHVSQRSVVRHQIESFNTFINYTLKTIVSENSDVTSVSADGHYSWHIQFCVPPRVLKPDSPSTARLTDARVRVHAVAKERVYPQAHLSRGGRIRIPAHAPRGATAKSDLRQFRLCGRVPRQSRPPRASSEERVEEGVSKRRALSHPHHAGIRCVLLERSVAEA